MPALHFTSETFEEEVLKSEKPVMVDFWAPWCGPCIMLAPAIEELSREVGDAAVVGKVNVDEEPELSSSYGVMSIPTVIVFKNGKPASKAVGVKSKNELKMMLD